MSYSIDGLGDTREEILGARFTIPRTSREYDIHGFVRRVTMNVPVQLARREDEGWYAKVGNSLIVFDVSIDENGQATSNARKKVIRHLNYLERF